MKKLFMFSLLFALLSGCGANDNNDDLINDYGKIYFRPEHMVDVQAETSLDALYMTTEKFYGNAGYVINASQYFANGTFYIDINGVQELEGGGATIMTRAYAYINLEGLDGTFPLIISGKNFRDEYKLTVNDKIISIEGPATIHTEPTLRSLEAGVNIRQ